MKRWTLRILICVLLGVVTTVGVAWSVAFFRNDHDVWATSSRGGFLGDSSDADSTFIADRRLIHESHMPTDVELENFVLSGSQGFGNDVIQMKSFFDNDRVYGQTATIRSGWVLPSLTATDGGLYRIDDTGTWVTVDEWGAGLLLDEPWIPWMPIFPGFLINTLFYAAIWFGLFFAPGMARRFIRTRRGRCPRCGYNLRGDTPHPQPLSQGERGVRGCPECGWGRGS